MRKFSLVEFLCGASEADSSSVGAYHHALYDAVPEDEDRYESQEHAACDIRCQGLEKLPVVGKTTLVVDYVKRINRTLHDDDPKYDIVPETKEEIGQYLFMFSMSAKPSDLDRKEYLNQERLSPEQEMVQDLMTIIHCFSSRLYGLRNYKKKLKEALEQDKLEAS